MTYHLARPVGPNDTVFWLSTPAGDLLDLARLVTEAETRTLRAALTRGRASPEYVTAVGAQVLAEAALAYAESLIDLTVESITLDTVLKVDSEYVVVRFVMEDCIEVGRAQFGSARASHSGAAEVATARLRVEALVDVELIIEGAPVSAGDKGDIVLAFDGRITGVKLLADVPGDIVVQIRKAAFPTAPTVSIVGGSPPTLSGASTYEDTALSGWTTAFARDDVLRVEVVFAAAVSRVTLSLTCTTAV